MDNIRVQWLNAPTFVSATRRNQRTERRRMDAQPQTTDENALWRQSKPQIERIYRAPAVSDRHFVGEDRMEANLHYLRGRTDALLRQLSNGGCADTIASAPYSSSYMPQQNPSLGMTDAQVISSLVRSSTIVPTRSTRTSRQPNVDASIASLQANKNSLNVLYQNLESLRSTLHDMCDQQDAPPVSARSAKSARYPSVRRPIDDTGFVHRVDEFQLRPFNSARDGVPLLRHVPRPVPVAVPIAVPVPVPAPPRPSTYMRYLRNVRQNVVDKDNVEELAATRQRNRIETKEKFDAKADYQPSRSHRPYNFEPSRTFTAGTGTQIAASGAFYDKTESSFNSRFGTLPRSFGQLDETRRPWADRYVE